MESTSTVPTLVLAVLIPDARPEPALEVELEPAAPAGVVPELLDEELPHAASPITAAARMGAASHRLRIVFSPFRYG